MKKEDAMQALRRMRDISKQRRFEQSVDITINFRGINFKKTENRLNVDVDLPFSAGKGKGKSLVFAKSKDFASALEGKVERIVMENEIRGLSKKEAAEIADEFSVLLAEGPVMLTVGKFLGQTLAPKGKMPKPVQPNVKQVEELTAKLASSTRVSNNKGKFMPLVHVNLGKESMKDEELAENVMAVYSAVVEKLSSKEQGIKSVLVKMTMGPPVKIGEKPGEEKASGKPKEAKLEEKKEKKNGKAEEKKEKGKLGEGKREKKKEEAVRGRKEGKEKVLEEKKPDEEKTEAGKSVKKESGEKVKEKGKGETQAKTEAKGGESK